MAIKGFPLHFGQFNHMIWNVIGSKVKPLLGAPAVNRRYYPFTRNDFKTYDNDDKIYDELMVCPNLGTTCLSHRLKQADFPGTFYVGDMVKTGMEVRTGWLREDYAVVTTSVDAMSYIIAPNLLAYPLKVGKKISVGNVLHATIYEMLPTFSIPIPPYITLPWTFQPTLPPSQLCSHPFCFNPKFCNIHSCFNCGK